MSGPPPSPAVAGRHVAHVVRLQVHTDHDAAQERVLVVTYEREERLQSPGHFYSLLSY